MFIGAVSTLQSQMATAKADVWAQTTMKAAAEAARLTQAANKAAERASKTAENASRAYMAARAARKRRGKALEMYDSTTRLTKSLKLKEAEVAHGDAEHVDSTSAAAISELKASKLRDDAYILFKEMVDKDEDLEHSVREKMMNKWREIFFDEANML